MSYSSNFKKNNDYVYNYFQIENHDTLKIQAYLFALAASFSAYKFAAAHIRYMKKELEKDLLPQIQTALCAFINNYLEKLNEYLTILLEREYWNTAEELELAFCSTARHATNENVPKKTVALKNTDCSLFHMLTRLGLRDKYPQKLTTKDALVISDEKTSEDSNPFNLPLIVLKKIMICDETSRNPENKDIEIGDSDDKNDEGDHDHHDENDEIHPVDIILSILHCSDDFLRQLLLYKLSLCQIAIPLLLPDPISGKVTLLHWALRSVERTWKSMSGQSCSQTINVVEYEGPIISFLKCENLQTSKSKLLNEVIGKENIFYHWELQQDRRTEIKACKGVIELCCYYPNQNAPFHKHPVIFTNLHGDAISYETQVHFIKTISFMSFVLVSNQSLENEDKKVIELIKVLSKSPGGVAIILVDAHKTGDYKTRLNCENLQVISIKDQTPRYIQNQIHTMLRKTLQKHSQHQFKSITSLLGDIRVLGIDIDKDVTECFKAKTRLEDIVKCAHCDLNQQKIAFFPLQGSDLWQKWAESDKEIYRHQNKPKNVTIEDYTLSLNNTKSTVRSKQLNSRMSSFIRCLLIHLLESKGVERNYYLHLLQTFLLRIGKNTLLHHHEKNKSIIAETPSHSDDKSKHNKDLLNQRNKNLLTPPIGLKTCFRELGQIYEAVKDTEPCPILNLKSKMEKLPCIAAEILAAGFPLEIIDGEASHVPVTWIKAVLQAVGKLFSGKKVFVLSILGVQSSGKSTLLNTMFGLRFNVSVGRCTRGAFIQLLEIDNEFKKELQCDVVLVIDTEGIRAPEIQNEVSDEHDNELSTLVIGLADLTIINIFGEAQHDIKDILQTAVHAFIRMKEIEKNPGCVFVHQSVTEKFADESLQGSKQKFVEQLDDLTLYIGSS